MGREVEIQKEREQLQNKTEYNRRKSLVYKMEQKNEDLIILFRSTGNWWKIGGKSVAYYVNVVAPRLSRSPNVHEDTDYDFCFKHGVVFVNDIERFFEDCKKAGFEEASIWKRAKDEEEKGIFAGIRALQLHNRISVEAYNQMIEDELAVWEACERMVLPRVVWPELKTKTLELQAKTRTATNSMVSDIKVVLGNKMIGQTIRLMEIQMAIARGLMEPLEGLDEMNLVLSDFAAGMMSVINMRLMNKEPAENLSRVANRVNKLVDIERHKELKKLEGSIEVERKEQRKTPRQIAKEAWEAKERATKKTSVAKKADAAPKANVTEKTKATKKQSRANTTEAKKPSKPSTPTLKQAKLDL